MPHDRFEPIADDVRVMRPFSKRTPLVTASDDLLNIAGGAKLVEWFSRVPHFHDAELLELKLCGN
jgi:hypothetical protein